MSTLKFPEGPAEDPRFPQEDCRAMHLAHCPSCRENSNDLHVAAEEIAAGATVISDLARFALEDEQRRGSLLAAIRLIADSMGRTARLEVMDCTLPLGGVEAS